MNITLRQLLPQCAGEVYVIQPRQGAGKIVTYVPIVHREGVFSDVELDTKIDYVDVVNGCLEIHMEVER